MKRKKIILVTKAKIKEINLNTNNISIKT